MVDHLMDASVSSTHNSLTNPHSPYCILYFDNWICNMLIQLDDGAQGLESLFQLFGLLLRQVLLQSLR